jgi:hypothetical protein
VAMVSNLLKCGALKVHHSDELEPYPKANRGQKGSLLKSGVLKVCHSDKL